MKEDSGNLDHSLTDVQRTIVIRVPFLTCHRAFLTTKLKVLRTSLKLFRNSTQLNRLHLVAQPSDRSCLSFLNRLIMSILIM